MVFSEKLNKVLDEWHLLKHPFYQAWMSGELKPSQLQNYAIQYYPHVLAFPRYVSAVHSYCEDAQARAELARNLADEEGIGGVGHPELWLRFSEGLGLKRQDVENAAVQPAAQKTVSTFFKHCRSSYAEGLASLYAYERQIPEIATTKIKGLKENYGIRSKHALEFFEVHEKADLYHSRACAKALDELPWEDQKCAETAAIGSAQALWDFLTESYAST